jgi:hypothetical protein
MRTFTTNSAKDSLAEQWMLAKSLEQEAVEKRRKVEDALVDFYGVLPTGEGTANFATDGHKIKIVSRLNRKVDTDKVQQIAAELGISDKLSTIFRWKAEINTTEWRAEPESIRAALSGAVTTTPGRPTFSIEEVK